LGGPNEYASKMKLRLLKGKRKKKERKKIQQKRKIISGTGNQTVILD